MTGFSSWDAQRRELLLDKDKTPTVSAVSRLENKYSDILERAAGRRRHEEDRDKTLEPDDYGGLLRSATSHQLAKAKLSSSSFNAADRKERTPYRTRAQRQRYMADSTDSGYLTSGNRLLDENYPVDYGHNRYQPHDYHDALRAGGATGYSTGRYGRRAGVEDTALTSGRLSRAYERTKTELPATDASDGGHAEDHVLNWRSRFANRRREQPAPPPELTAEDHEILADDRSSEDNAAILMLLREDNQFLEAKKFEERMRRRRELKERVKRMEEAAAEAKKTEAAAAAAAEAEAMEQQAANEAAAIAATAAGAAAAAAAPHAEEAPKKKSRSKKVTNDDSDASSSSTSEASSDEVDSEPNRTTGVQLTNTADTSQKTKSTTDKANTPTNSINGTSIPPITTTATTTATTNSNNNTNSSNIPSALSNLSLHDTAATATASGSGSSANKKSHFLLHSDRNNNDLSKYRPSNLLHSSSSGALAFGGIGARLAAADTRRQQQQQQLRYQGASSRTAAVLSEFERYKPSSGSSYLHDNYGISSRRSNAVGSSLYPHRQQLDPYQQQQQHQQQSSALSSSSSHYLQQHDHYLLSKSATSSALFHRSRIPKTLSTFVSHSMHYSMQLELLAMRARNSPNQPEHTLQYC